MQKKTNTTAVKSGSTPDFIAYAVVNRAHGEGKSKAKWREIGTAWLHNDGNGLR